MYYHTSEDIPNKLDATQMKRAAIIAAAGAYNIASADENMAATIAETAFSYGCKRMGIELARALDELKYLEVEAFETSCKKINGYLETTFKNEIATIVSVLELAPGSAALQQQINVLTKSMEQLYEANRAVLETKVKTTAAKLGVDVPLCKLSKLEKLANEIIYKPSAILKTSGYGIERKIRDLPESTKEKYPYKSIGNTTELCALINGKNSALDIKKMLDTQYKRESDLQSIINYLALLQEADLIEK
jgi:hypothetical protein